MKSRHNLPGIEGEGKFSCNGKSYKIILNIQEENIKSDDAFTINPNVLHIIKHIFNNYNKKSTPPSPPPIVPHIYPNINSQNIIESLFKRQDVNKLTNASFFDILKNVIAKEEVAKEEVAKEEVVKEEIVKEENILNILTTLFKVNKEVKEEKKMDKKVVENLKNSLTTLFDVFKIDKSDKIRTHTNELINIFRKFNK